MANIKWTPINWFSSLIRVGREWFLFENRHTDTTMEASWSILDIILGTITVVGVYIRHVVGYFEEYIMLALVFNVWVASSGFARKINELLKEERSSTGLHLKLEWASIKKAYMAVRRQADLVNIAIRANIFGHTILTFFYYSFNFDIVLNVKDASHQMRFALYVLSGVTFYGLAPDICRKV